jgi:hypothetical protein
MVRLPAQPLYFVYKGYEYEKNKKIREHILCALVGETGFEQWKVLIYLVASS